MAQLFADLGKELRIVSLHLGEKLPASLESVEAAVIMGGYMNVYQEKEFPYLADEDNFIKQALRDNVPLLGICLGGQLIAKAAGAPVTCAPRPEIGWDKVTLSEEGLKDPLFKGFHNPVIVFQWHGDQFALPQDAVLLASSPVCNQAFRLGKAAYALQFQIVMTKEMINAWFGELSKEDQKKYQAILPETTKLFPDSVTQASQFVKNFLRILK
jgi:GMP synthase (glutamine-hydrolysing)